MSERPVHRRPATFKLDDPGVIVMDPDDASRPSRGTGLGFLGSAFAGAATLASIVVIGREAFGLARLATIEKLHLRAAEVLLTDDRAASRTIVQELVKIAHLSLIHI